MTAAPEKTPTRRWLARAGQAAFWFFLIKGLLWITVPAVIAYLGWQATG